MYRAAVGLLLHGSPDNVICNNIFAYCRVADLWVHPESYNVPPMKNVLRRNIWYRGTGQLFKFVGTEPHRKRFWPKEPFAEFDDNLYDRGADSVELGFGRGFDQHSVVADPLFRNPERGDFYFDASSPAAKLGIKPINLTGACPRGQ